MSDFWWLTNNDYCRNVTVNYDEPDCVDLGLDDDDCTIYYEGDTCDLEIFDCVAINSAGTVLMDTADMFWDHL